LSLDTDPRRKNAKTQQADLAGQTAPTLSPPFYPVWIMNYACDSGQAKFGGFGITE